LGTTAGQARRGTRIARWLSRSHRHWWVSSAMVWVVARQTAPASTRESRTTETGFASKPHSTSPALTSLRRFPPNHPRRLPLQRHPDRRPRLQPHRPSHRPRPCAATSASNSRRMPPMASATMVGRVPSSHRALMARIAQTADPDPRPQRAHQSSHSAPL